MNIIRDNLMSQPGYTPYCGNLRDCKFGAPRSTFDGKQFVCGCGWRSGFEAEFIKEYKDKWSKPAK